MNRFIYSVIIALVIPIGLHAQRREKEDRIVYFTDDQVKRSSLFLTSDFSPMLSNRSVLGQRGAGFTPGQTPGEGVPRSRGAFAYHFGAYAGIRISSALEFSVGYSQNSNGWLNRRTEFESISTETRVNINQMNVPFQFTFYSKMNDFLTLEVMPIFELNWIRSYTEDIQMRNDPFTNFGEFDLLDESRKFNISIGIGIGGRYEITDQFSLYLRPFFRYMINPLIENEERPREVVWGIGIMTGLRFDFL
jgi:hypothetical protein